MNRPIALSRLLVIVSSYLRVLVSSCLRPLALALITLALLPTSLHPQSQADGPGPGKPQGPPAAQAAPAVPVGEGITGARTPLLSPDGKTLAFTLWGDIWVVPAAGGRATRLTMNEANDVRPVWSPDGKRFAFTSDRSGSWDVWTMPADGGAPTRLTFDSGMDLANEWSPDGKWIYFSANATGEWRVFRIPPDGGTPDPVTLDMGMAASVLPGVGDAPDTVYYLFQASDAKIKGYRGSANDDLFVCTPGGNPTQLTRDNQNERDPRISPDGKTLYFTRETGATGKDYNLFALDLATKTEKQLSALDENGMSQLTLSRDGKRVHFLWKFRVYTIDLSVEPRTPALVPIEVVEDARRDPTVERSVTSGAESVDISADGKRMTIEVGGSIWVMDAAGGSATPLTPDGYGDHMPRLSPDGKTICFYSNRKGNDDLWLINSDGQNLRPLTLSPEGEHFQNWSPDGHYLIFSADRANIRNIWRINVDGTQPVMMTNAPFNSDDPSVSPDGKLIAYDSWGKGNADIYVMNVNATGGHFVYGTLAQEESPRWSPDGKMLVLTRTSTNGIANVRTVVVTDLAGTGEVVIGDGHDGSFTPDGKEILYVDEKGQIKTVPAPTDVMGGRTIPFLATRKVAQADEFKRVFEEAFARIAENFYDPKFHGVDMQALHRRYLPMITESRTRLEFYTYLNELVGELKASHQGVTGPITDTPGYATGLLGCELLPTAIPHKKGEDEKAPHLLALKVVRPTKGSPSDKAWIRDGDYILGVGDKRLTMSDNFFQKLENTAGKNVQLQVGTALDGSDIRQVTVVPEDFNAQRGREYGLWIAKCRETATTSSEGKVGYIHIPAMNGQALRDFENQLGSKEVQAAKALVLDVRDNGGGNIHQQLIDILSRRHYADNTTQKGEAGKSPGLFWDRPVVLLVNRRSYSDAEVFPHAFKTLGLGTIVGEPTSGSVIGTNDVTLSDGTGLRLTTWGFKDLDGKDQEGNGCVPDVVVETTAQDRIDGKDPQLAQAIVIALAKIAVKPAETTPTPAPPKDKPTPQPTGTTVAEKPKDAPIPGVGPAGETKKLFNGFQFTEGPTSDAAGNVWFSDVRANRIYRVDPSGTLSTLLEESQGCNGLMFDARAKRLVACQGAAGRIIAIDPATKAVTSLAAEFEGKRFSRPNDLVVDRQGGVYFTDPAPKIKGASQEKMGVYYVDLAGIVVRVIADLDRPNGVRLSPDEKTLYVVPSGTADVMAYPVEAPGKLGAGRVLCSLAPAADGKAHGGDGLAVDSHGNLYLAVPALSAIQVVSAEGKTLGMIPLAEPPSNCAFGGTDGKTLYVTARTSLYAVPMEAVGCRAGAGN